MPTHYASIAVTFHAEIGDFNDIRETIIIVFRGYHTRDGYHLKYDVRQSA